ncbi:UNC93-like protein [Fulvia fulva]|uniref:UNC93-like protein n=1 Tax=Passalora fulva TaxID=5499 RepID=A0A9Q8PCB0_PASFU|nr:UNC93-like protein [Fulvia fulva]KAK4619744.1 UNC93-like protein [Fulvia fulva]KAK4621088.1 UNC93-like protein [Fulvia fulva]UJO19820.1 UNC93-like protein [Fulvia fulva]WPV16937.1 UNC93-like protein [Fulvia fulva]WPV32693.1 UNC93-like protein [Fulvia fulva]
MASISDKATPTTEIDSQHHSQDGSNDEPRPVGWMYKSRKIGPITIPYYASPKAQLILVAFVCFLCPGMFNALNGLGGGGQLDATAGNDSNTALYSTFSVVGFFAGTIVNTVGIKAALSFGGIGYCVYVSAYLCYNFTANLGYMIFSGALLGVCAGILWSAQGAIMMSYPTESEKGRFISWFWMIFNLGGVIGSLVPLGQNINTTSNGTVSNGTYIGFLVLTTCGAILSTTLVNAKSVVRSDGSRVILMKHPSWKSELYGLYETLLSDPYIILLFPMFFASNWFYTYQFNGVNLAQFNVRTRSLNSVLYWSAQILGAWVFGNALDISKFKRTTRAKGAWVALFALTMIIWGGGYAFQVNYTRDRVEAEAKLESTDPSRKYFIDWEEGRYIGPMFLYIFYGFYDAAWQTSVYWYMGSISNNGRKLANFAGFYKGIQSAGAAITWRIDALGVPYMHYFASCWALLGGSLIIALPVMLLKIHDTTPVEKDLEFTDETLADVVGEKPVGAMTTDVERSGRD